MVAILWVLAVKINLPEIIEKIRLSVAESIENAKTELANAKIRLKSAKKDTKNATMEAEEKIKLAKENADGLSKDILKNANEQVKKIEANVYRVIESEEKKVSANLTQETMKNAVELAKLNLVQKLKSDKEIHERLISDCIKELDGISL